MMLTDTLYAQYIQEREGAQVLESKDGFAIYRINGNECYIRDMSVDPSKRQQGIGKDLISQLSDIARFNGCEFVTAHVWMFDPNKSKTLFAALKVGFEVVACDAGSITIALKVKE
jgi:GNAT superfamily N-acetyltransferase